VTHYLAIFNKIVFINKAACWVQNAPKLDSAIGEYKVFAVFLLESREGSSSLFSFLLPSKALGVSMPGEVF